MTVTPLMKRSRAVVIGAGLGGLAVALRLQGQGFDVTEISPDPADIMSHPGKGGVLRDHFEILTRALAQKKQ